MRNESFDIGLNDSVMYINEKDNLREGIVRVIYDDYYLIVDDLTDSSVRVKKERCIKLIKKESIEG